MRTVPVLRWPAILLGAFLTASAPVTITDRGALTTRTAECQTGTCCPEDKSVCVIGSSKLFGYYQKASGSCSGNES